uniref:Uncharacterized protein n=1 Tax=Anguilla anguilla TaxID=7936 RepID=A0A0E9X331_ANGAN
MLIFLIWVLFMFRGIICPFKPHYFRNSYACDGE